MCSSRLLLIIIIMVKVVTVYKEEMSLVVIAGSEVDLKKQASIVISNKAHSLSSPYTAAVLRVNICI